MTDNGIKVKHVRADEEYFDAAEFIGIFIAGLVIAVLPFMAGMAAMTGTYVSFLLAAMYIVMLLCAACTFAQNTRSVIRHRTSGERGNAGGKKA